MKTSSVRIKPSPQPGPLDNLVRAKSTIAGLIGTVVIVTIGFFHSSVSAQTDPGAIDLGTREALVFKIDGSYGARKEDVSRAILKLLPSISRLPQRKQTSDGCNEWVNFKCVRVDRDAIAYKGVSFALDRDGNAFVKYEESSKALFVPIAVSVKKMEDGKNFDVSIEFPKSVKPGDKDGVLGAAFGSLFGQSRFPMTKPEELRSDILGIFDAIKETVTSGRLLMIVDYSFSGELKSEYPPASIAANFERLGTISLHKDGERFSSKLEPAKFEKSGPSFTAMVQILPYRNGASITYSIPMIAKLYSDGRSEADADADMRKEILLKIINY